MQKSQIAEKYDDFLTSNIWQRRNNQGKISKSDVLLVVTVVIATPYRKLSE